jgi:alpha-L-fucosidase
VPQEGPTRVRFESTGQRKREGFNVRFTEEDFWFTQRDGRLYAIALVRPESGLARIRNFVGLPVQSLRVIGEAGTPTWRDTEEALEVRLPAFSGDGIGYVLELTLEGSAQP